MKEIVPTPPAIVQSQFAEVRELFNRYVVPSYGRFEIAFSHGAGNHLWTSTESVMSTSAEASP